MLTVACNVLLSVFGSGFAFLIFLFYISFPIPKSCKKRKNAFGRKKKERVTTPQQLIYDWASQTGKNNVVIRQLQPSCHQLRHFDRTSPSLEKGLKVKLYCYGCGQVASHNHPIYVFSCRDCGDKFQRYRHLSRDLGGHVAVVIGARTKLGHQVVVKLLEAGATVVGTTRFPQKALELYRKYPEWEKWKKQLKIYPKSLDWDVENIAEQGRKLVRWIENDLKLPAVDILVLSAAQTIRARDKRSDEKSATEDEDTNRYEDSRFVKDCQVNSWQMKLHDLVQQEMEEVYRINAIAPCLLLQQIIPLLKKSPVNPYIVFVHAREGLFTVPKNQKHIHTNMAKAGLSMLTKCLKGAKLHTETGKPMYSHGIDPGWISVDEYHETNRPWIVPPLDEIDGAARILYPVMKRMQGSFMKTRRHFDQLLY